MQRYIIEKESDVVSDALVSFSTGSSLKPKGSRVDTDQKQ